MNNKHIKNFIVESGLISDNDIEKANDLSFEKNISFSDALLEMEVLDKDMLSKIFANISGVSKIDLRSKNISLENFQIIPEPVCRQYNFVAFASDENSVSVAFCEIDNLDILENILPQKLKLKIFLADREEIFEKSKKYSELISEELSFKNESNLKKISRMNGSEKNEDTVVPENFWDDIANEVYTEKFVNGLLEYALNNRADFIFFNLLEDKVSISIRIFDRNYTILSANKNIMFSVSLKLKELCDVNFFEEFVIKQSSFVFDYQKVNHSIYTTFIKTDFGENITIQIDKDKKFKTDIVFMTEEQKEILYRSQRKDSGFLIFSGDSNEEQKKTLYSFVEFDIEKNKEIYLLEKKVSDHLNGVKQISVSNQKNILFLLLKIIENHPDVLGVEKISKGIFPMLFNYVSISKKVFVSVKDEIGKILDLLFEMKFDKGQIIKNFSILVEHKSFRELNKKNRKKYFLTEREVKTIKEFLTEREISENFKNAGMEKVSKKTLSKIEFFMKKSGGKINLLTSKKQSNKVDIRGVLNLGLFLENNFLKKSSLENIKNNLRKEVKKKVLENALLSCVSGKTSIKEVLKYLTK